MSKKNNKKLGDNIGFLNDRESILLFLSSAFILFVSNAIDVYIIEKNLVNYDDETYPIIDPLQRLLPNTLKYIKLFDVVMVMFCFWCLFMFETTVRRNYLRCVLIFLMFRSLCMYSTLMPKHKNCKSSIIIGCYDKMFSGHVGVTLLTSMFIKDKYPHLKWVIVAFNVLCFFFVISSRYHYTVDCLVSIYVSYTLYLLRDKIEATFGDIS